MSALPYRHCRKTRKPRTGSSALFKRGDVIGELLDLVEAADFHSPRHRAAFAAAAQLARRQAPIDYGMLSEEMAVSGAMSATEALQWLADVDLRIPSAAHARHYAEIVVRYADWRRCIGVAQRFAETAYRAVGDPAEAMSAAIQRIVDIRRNQDADLVAPTAWAERTWQDLHTGTTRILAGLPSGLHELDLATLGLVASELYVLAARTSVGKTTLMMQVAHHVATHSGPVLFVSCEMRPDLLFDRTLAATAEVSVNRLARRSFQALEWTRVEKGLHQLAETPLYVLRRRYQSAEIRDAVLRLEARNQRPVLILVDFIQMLKDQAGDGRNPSTNMGEATKRLKLIGEDFGVPVLAASQFNRESEYQQRPPSLADLSLSDQIAHYADSVLALHRTKDEDGGRRTLLLTLNDATWAAQRRTARRNWCGPARATPTRGQRSFTSGSSMNMRAEPDRGSATTAESGAPDEVMVRIRKLFALAGSPNEHEAALALEKAHALLLRYNLRAEAVTNGADACADDVTDVWLPGFGGYLWRSALLGVLAGHCFCQPLRTRDQVVLVGRPTNIATVRALYAWLVPQLERLCLEEFEPMRGESRPPLCPRRVRCKGVALERRWLWWSCPRCGQDWSDDDRRLRRRPPIVLRTFKVAFMAGAVERIDDRLRMQRYAEMVQVVASRSLMLATDVENDNYIARRFSFVRSGPEREHSVDRAAFQSGWRRAQEISLSNRPALPAARHRRSGRR